MSDETRFRMPAEWQSQSATWMSWPQNAETWPENLSEAQSEFVEFARTVANFQPVNVMASGRTMQQAELMFGGINNIELIDIPTNDAWARDYAPTFVKDLKNNRLVAIDWHYNAWGGKYPPFDDDQKVARRVAELNSIDCVSPDLCFEGGAIEINDSGVLLSTSSCALDPNRNPDKSLEDVEKIFRHYLGATQIVWLSGNAIDGDDTDGHIDQLARFTDEKTIVYASCDKSDPQHDNLIQNLLDLKTGVARFESEGVRLIPLPLPPAIFRHGRRIPASYCNFVIANGLVVVPQFGEAYCDRQAIEILTPLFPDQEVVGLSSLNLSVGLGSFHCLSQQQPAIDSSHTN